MSASDHLSGSQFGHIDHEALARLHSHDFDVPMPHVLDELRREHSDYVAGNHDAAHSKDIEHGGPDKYIEHLKADIAKNGMQTPIEIRNGAVRDGTHRGVAAMQLKMNRIPVEYKR